MDVSIFAFASLVGVPVGIASLALRLKICAITARIKNYKLIISQIYLKVFAILNKNSRRTLEWSNFFND